MRVSRLVTRTSADLDLNSELYSLRVGAAVAFASCLQLSQSLQQITTTCTVSKAAKAVYGRTLRTGLYLHVRAAWVEEWLTNGNHAPPCTDVRSCTFVC